MDNHCYLHKDRTATKYCTNCLRPICDACYNYNSGLCPECSNEINSTFYSYYKKWGLKLLIGAILLSLLYYDVFMYSTGLVGTNKFIAYGVVISCIVLIPIFYYIYNYNFKNGIKYLFRGIDNYDTLKHNLKDRNSKNLLIAIISYLVCCLLFLLSYLILVIGLLIKSISFLVKQHQYKKKILTPLEIKNL